MPILAYDTLKDKVTAVAGGKSSISISRRKEVLKMFDNTIRLAL
jgi:hypothetical protein